MLLVSVVIVAPVNLTLITTPKLEVILFKDSYVILNFSSTSSPHITGVFCILCLKIL